MIYVRKTALILLGLVLFAVTIRQATLLELQPDELAQLAATLQANDQKPLWTAVIGGLSLAVIGLGAFNSSSD